MKRPDRFSRSFARLGFLSARGLRWTQVTMKPVRSELASVVARVESLRGRNSAFEPREAGRQAPCRACRDIDGLCEA